MRWILRLGIFLALALVAAVVGFYLRRDAGMVYLRFHGWEVETTVVFLGVAVLLLGLLALALYTMVVRWPRRFGWRRRARATARLDQGLVLAFEGKLHDAQRSLLAASTEPLQRLSALLSAAEVAHRRGETGLVDDILRNASELERGRQIAPLLADAWRAERGDESAFEAVVSRAAQSDAPPLVLRTLVEGLLARGRAEEALAPLQRLAEARQIGDREFALLERRVLAQALERAPDREALDALWQRFGKQERRDRTVLAALIQAESRLGSRDLAAVAIEAALTKEWSEELAELYAQAPVEQASPRIKRAEKMLAKYPQSPGLLLALARWCRIEQIFGKAQEYLRLSLSLKPRPIALIEAARLAEARSEPDRALLAWRLAAESAQGIETGSAELQQLTR
ncbi:MAG: heme biosynthesis HemY N-terminal domain-containing protein [Lysobacterales bacterium]